MLAAETAHHAAEHDILFVAVSVALAFAGSFAALVSAIRIPFSTGAARTRWIASAALALGGGAIWSMHYTGMAAMRAGSPVSYDPILVAVSVGIAIFAALAALAIAFRVEKMHHVAVASVVMAVAVCGMHYTAMAATRVAVTDTPTVVRGADPISLGLAVCVVSFIVLAMVIFAALGGVTDDGAFRLAAQGGSHRRPAAGGGHAADHGAADEPRTRFDGPTYPAPGPTSPSAPTSR